MHLYSYCTLSTIIAHYIFAHFRYLNIILLYYGLAGRRLNSHASTKLYNNIVKCTACFIIVIINSDELSYPIMYTCICCTEEPMVSHPEASFFFGVYSWLVKVLGQFSIIYFRGLGLRIGVRVWVRVRVGVWVRVRVRVRVRVSVVLLSG